MATKITIEKKPFPNSVKYDFATFDMEGDVTESEVLKEFHKVIKELGWFKDDKAWIGILESDSECTSCGTSIAEGVTNDT